MMVQMPVTCPHCDTAQTIQRDSNIHTKDDIVGCGECKAPFAIRSEMKFLVTSFKIEQPVSPTGAVPSPVSKRKVK